MKRRNAPLAQNEADCATPAAPAPLALSSRLWLRRTKKPVHHEHVRLAGHDTDVTTDELGVVELHLE